MDQWSPTDRRWLQFSNKMQKLLEIFKNELKFEWIGSFLSAWAWWRRRLQKRAACGSLMRDRTAEHFSQIWTVIEYTKIQFNPNRFRTKRVIYRLIKPSITHKKCKSNQSKFSIAINYSRYLILKQKRNLSIDARTYTVAQINSKVKRTDRNSKMYMRLVRTTKSRHYHVFYISNFGRTMIHVWLQRIHNNRRGSPKATLIHRVHSHNQQVKLNLKFRGERMETKGKWSEPCDYKCLNGQTLQ